MCLGEFYNRRHRYKNAIGIFEKGIQVNHDYALLYRDLALSYFEQGNMKESINNIKIALQKGLEEKDEKHAKKLLEIWEKIV